MNFGNDPMSWSSNDVLQNNQATIEQLQQNLKDAQIENTRLNRHIILLREDVSEIKREKYALIQENYRLKGDNNVLRGHLLHERATSDRRLGLINKFVAIVQKLQNHGNTLQNEKDTLRRKNHRLERNNNVLRGHLQDERTASDKREGLLVKLAPIARELLNEKQNLRQSVDTTLTDLHTALNQNANLQTENDRLKQALDRVQNQNASMLEVPKNKKCCDSLCNIF